MAQQVASTDPDLSWQWGLTMTDPALRTQALGHAARAWGRLDRAALQAALADPDKAVEHLPVAVVPNLARWLAEIKRDDLWSYAAAGDGEQSLWQADLTGGVVLVFGAEGKGVRQLVRKTCDSSIAITLAAGVESLNVSVAAAVLLYEARRQRSAS